MERITYVMLPTILIIAASASVVFSGTSNIRWKTYHSSALGVRVKVPSAWVVEKTTQALAFHSPGSLENRAGLGLMRSGNRGSIKKAVDARTATRGLEDWSRKYMRVGGMQALEVIGHPQGNPKMKIVRYFITTPSGPYLLQCIAPAETWLLYRELFSNIIGSIRFL